MEIAGRATAARWSSDCRSFTARGLPSRQAFNSPLKIFAIVFIDRRQFFVGFFHAREQIGPGVSA